jgi:Ca2+-binding EF-hand superfamily protein
MHEQFMRNNPDGNLDKTEFVRLYITLEPEEPSKLDEIAVNVFKAFDKDNNGTINFNEFMVAYALTSRGDNEEKLAYAFELYDADDSGTLDAGEIRAVLHSMIDMLGANKQKADYDGLVNECFRDLDISGDASITKGNHFCFCFLLNSKITINFLFYLFNSDEFIQGLLKNYSLRSVMSPFN